jgi:MFS family permease
VTPLTRFALLAVVFVDPLGQGLVFPIINTLMMDQETGFPPVSAPMATREFNYGLVIGIFFLCWFLGAAYIAKVSDAIGRKNAILICLFGALFGYILTICRCSSTACGCSLSAARLPVSLRATSRSPRPPSST